MTPNTKPQQENESSSSLNSAAFPYAKVLIVDDQPANVIRMEAILAEAGYSNVRSTCYPESAAKLYLFFAPDIVLLDLRMPKVDGLGVLRQIKASCSHVPVVSVIVLTDDISQNFKYQALASGASDFVTKPFDVFELLLRLNHALELHFLQKTLEEKQRLLEETVRSRTFELELARDRNAEYAERLEEAQFETLERLARAGEFRDDQTGQHTLRVAEMTAKLASGIGFPAEQLSWLKQAARLHDVGKIGIPDEILLKPGKLTPSELKIVRSHTLIGSEILRNGRSTLFQMAKVIAECHHERWDGTGYPHGLKGDDCPLVARLVALADVFDALSHERPYKKAWPHEEVIEEIKRQRCFHFDPDIVDVFLTLPL